MTPFFDIVRSVADVVVYNEAGGLGEIDDFVVGAEVEGSGQRITSLLCLIELL